MNYIILFSISLLLGSLQAAAQRPGYACQGDSCLMVWQEEKSSLKRMVKTLRNPNQPSMIIVRGKKNYGYSTEKGIAVIPFLYDYAHPFVDGYAIVVLDGLYGVIDSTGKQVVPFRYKGLSVMKEGLAFFSLNGKIVEGIVDSKGKERTLDPLMGSIDAKVTGSAMSNVPIDDGRFVFDVAPLIPYSFSEGLAIFNKKVMNKEGRYVFTSLYPIENSKEGMLRIAKTLSDGKMIWYGFMDQSGKIVIPPIYHTAGDFVNGKCTVASGNPNAPVRKIIDKNGAVLEVLK